MHLKLERLRLGLGIRVAGPGQIFSTPNRDSDQALGGQARMPTPASDCHNFRKRYDDY